MTRKMVSLQEYQKQMQANLRVKNAPQKRKPPTARKRTPVVKCGLTLREYEGQLDEIDRRHGLTVDADDPDGELSERGESEAVVLSEHRGRPLGARRAMTEREYRAKLDAIEKRYL